MSTAVACARLVGVAARAETAWSRNGGAVSLAAPVAGPAAISCAFAESAAVKRSGATGALVARAAEVFGDVATEDLAEPQQGSKLYVGNLPWSCDSAALAEICMDIGAVEAVEVIYDQETGRSRGFAFVTMASTEDAQAVINGLNGSDMEGRPLKVSFPQSNRDKPRFERSERSDRRPAGRERRSSPQADNPNKLFVGNLSWGCDEGALQQLFSDYGQVVEAKVVYDRESGRSRGFGFVTLAKPTEVNAAIENLDGAEFEGRQMRVNLAGEKPPLRQY